MSAAEDVVAAARRLARASEREREARKAHYAAVREMNGAGEALEKALKKAPAPEGGE